METTQQECEDNQGTWVEEGGEWMCKHPEASEETSETPDTSVEM